MRGSTSDSRDQFVGIFGSGRSFNAKPNETVRMQTGNKYAVRQK